MAIPTRGSHVDFTKEGMYNIADSTDWLATPLRQFADVEAVLRCQVCKDFFTTPMITSCSHTFCSLCIRRCLSNDGKCPACRSPEQELKLRSNVAVESIAEAFQKARPAALEYAHKQAKIVEASPIPALDGTKDDDDDRPRKRTRASTKKNYSESPNIPLHARDKDSDSDFGPDEDDDLVACPICSTRMKMEMINSHLDRCSAQPAELTRKTTTSGLSTLQVSGKQPERLPHLSYSLYKEAALRKKLQELGISAAGTKPLLERRHTEWVTLWNANCDSSRPRRKQELLRDLEIWERTQGGYAPIGHSLNGNNEVRNKDFDIQGWSTKHDTSYKTLIETARKKLGAANEISAKQSPSSDQNPISDSLDIGATESETSVPIENGDVYSTDYATQEVQLPR